MRQQLAVARKPLGGISLLKIAKGGNPITSIVAWEPDRQQIGDGIEIIWADLTATYPAGSSRRLDTIIFCECANGHVGLSTMCKAGTAGECHYRSYHAAFCAHWMDPFKYISAGALAVEDASSVNSLIALCQRVEWVASQSHRA
jgi:hypothetical protein